MAWYVNFDGIEGSSQHKDHQKWCIAQRVEMNGHKAGGGGTGVTRIGGKMHLDDLVVDVISDKGGPKLKEAAVKGKVFTKVEIHGTATYGDAGEQTYDATELENVQVTSFTWGAVDNDSATDDFRLTLNYEKLKSTYTVYTKDGKSDGKVEFEWKVEEGES